LWPPRWIKHLKNLKEVRQQSHKIAKKLAAGQVLSWQKLVPGWISKFLDKKSPKKLSQRVQ